MDYEGNVFYNPIPPEMQREIIDLQNPKITVEHRKRSIGYKLHRHNFFELEFYVGGKGINEINGIKTNFSNGSVYLYNETDFHKLSLEPGTEADIYYIGFNWGMINKKSFVYDKLTGATPIAVNIYDNRLEYQRFLDLLQSMLMEYENDFPYKDEYLMNALENLLIITFRLEKDDGEDGKSSNTVAKQALIFIQKNFRKDIGLNSIARELHTSPNYLSSAFHKSYSKTVVSYINDMRLNYASNALRTDSAVSITDVCFECGYKTYSHFLKDFGKKFGISPKKYQKTHRF